MMLFIYLVASHMRRKAEQRRNLPVYQLLTILPRTSDAMKPISLRAAILALLTITMAGASPGQAQDQTAAPPVASTDSGLPPGVATGSQTAEVLKLAQAGLDPSVISAYVANAPSAFNLNADQIITLKDAGVPSETINAMMDHDKNIMATTTTADRKSTRLNSSHERRSRMPSSA